MGLVLTYDCNFDCSYCFESNANKDENTLMTEEMIDRIEDIFPNIEYPFIWREPLLEKIWRLLNT